MSNMDDLKTKVLENMEIASKTLVEKYLEGVVENWEVAVYHLKVWDERGHVVDEETGKTYIPIHITMGRS